MTYLPQDVLSALEAAHKAMQRKSKRLCIHVGDDIYPVSQLSEASFAISADDAPKLRGFVELYDGPRHLSQCLIMTSREESGDRIYDFKWNTAVANSPAVDYVREENAPIALIAGH